MNGDHGFATGAGVKLSAAFVPARSSRQLWLLLMAVVLLVAGCSGGVPVPSEPYSVSGRVTELSTGRGLANVTLYFSGGFGTTKTGEDGTWAVTQLRGSVTITPVLPGYVFQPASRVVSGPSSKVDFIATTDTSGKEPIAGAAVITLAEAQAWARRRGARQIFIDVAAYYWQLAPRYGIRPEVAYAQSAKETGFGAFTGAVSPDFHNWCGLKTRYANGDDPDDHARFPDDETGVRAHFQHLAAYAGLPLPPGESIVDPRYELVSKGSARYVEDLGGRWAPNPDYGRSIVRDYLNDMLGR
ncbi:MAG: glucosaminidase domain-containing protein [Limnochordales bacterium]|nr:glucosaminidase domain-containing protein [Limnochordales bacterium]